MSTPSAYNVFVIGAGPAGLAAGIAWAKTGADVCVLERNNAAGRKMQLAGAGQCNVTHAASPDEFIQHYGDHKNNAKKANFVKAVYRAFDNTAAVRFFERCGVPMFTREDGKVFPQSLRAEDLVNALVQELQHSGGTLRFNAPVQNVHRTETGFAVEVKSETGIETYIAQKLVIAAGGESYPATGSQGDGFRFAAALGHRIVPPKPALTPIIVRNYAFADCAGISFRSVPISLYRNEKAVCKDCGDLLLTHHGLSGPVILNMSRHIEPEDTVRVQLAVPEQFTPERFTGKRTLKNVLLDAALPERFLLQLFNVLDIPPDLPAAETNRSVRQTLTQTLTALPFIVDRIGSWNQAMVTSGGVALDEVNRQTMESRLVGGLYFCGEVLDIDGDTGGYNIQFALSSGFANGWISVAAQPLSASKRNPLR